MIMNWRIKKNLIQILLQNNTKLSLDLAFIKCGDVYVSLQNVAVWLKS